MIDSLAIVFAYLGEAVTADRVATVLVLPFAYWTLKSLPTVLKNVRSGISTKVRVKRIGSSSHALFAGFCELYEQEIEECSRVDSQTIGGFLDTGAICGGATQSLLVCVRAKEVVGFTQIFSDSESEASFLTYFAVKNGEMPATDAKDVANKLSKRLARIAARQGKAGFILVEVESPNEPDIENSVRQRRLALIRRIRILANSVNRRAALLDIDYVQPEMVTDYGRSISRKLGLMVIANKPLLQSGFVDKGSIIRAISFVYFKVYRASYWPDDTVLNNIYRADLEYIIDGYETRWPSRIPFR
jgi:hypothetical protein